MRRYLSLGLMVATFLICTVCAARPAALPDSEASLGGVTLGANMSYVESIYGSPSDSKWTKDTFGNRVLQHKYGNGFYILESRYGGKSYINELYSTANNGLGTPMGIAVGVSEDSVFGIYGEGKPVKTENGVRSYVYTTVHGMHVDLKTKKVNGEYRVSEIHMRFEG